jgi:predicted nucleic acid-binding protein
MKRALFDINVILDVIFEREPHVETAAALWREVERGKLSGFVPAHGVTTIFYLAEKELGQKAAREIVDLLLSVFGVAAVDDEVLREALVLPCPDFEDAVCAASAQRAKCDMLITRDVKGYLGAEIQVVAPSAALAALTTLAKR